MSEARPGDKVRITFDAIYPDAGAGHIAVALHKIVTVEVIEHADDPSKDPVGTVRQRPGTGHHYVKVYGGSVLRFSDCVWVSPVTGGGNANEDVTDWPITGAVPGTPAAKADEPKVRYFRAINHGWRNRRALPDGTVQHRMHDAWCDSSAWPLAELEARTDLWVEVSEP